MQYRIKVRLQPVVHPQKYRQRKCNQKGKAEAAKYAVKTDCHMLCQYTFLDQQNGCVHDTRRRR